MAFKKSSIINLFIALLAITVVVVVMTGQDNQVKTVEEGWHASPLLRMLNADSMCSASHYDRMTTSCDAASNREATLADLLLLASALAIISGQIYSGMQWGKKRHRHS